MKSLRDIFERNRQWAAQRLETDPRYFERRADMQTPQFLFIGCCDSRVSAELLTGAKPGEIFTHRNIANQAHSTDINMLSALEYAVDVLRVQHVIVCGHYNCGGIEAAMKPPGHMLVDNWLHVVRDLLLRHDAELTTLPAEERFKRLVELNVVEQVFQLSRTPVIRHSWNREQRPTLHGLVYDLHDGLLKELVSGIDSDARARELREV